MTEPQSDEDLVSRQVIVSEVIDPQGGCWITTSTEGDPSPWAVMGLLTYALELLRRDVADSREDDDQ